jgi:hypothetical protein
MQALHAASSPAAALIRLFAPLVISSAQKVFLYDRNSATTACSAAVSS